ncbi:MAG: alginate lyase family protein [Opitutaceae bacterium]
MTTGLTSRLAYQISPTGAQPLELARTNSLNYSCFNLEALFSCAQLARHVAIDWHQYTTTDGRSLRAALTYLAPYVDPAKLWPKQDLVAADRTRLVPLLHIYLQQHADPKLRQLYDKFSATSPANARWRLLNNAPFPSS